jgi:hypothetical protein
LGSSRNAPLNADVIVFEFCLDHDSDTARMEHAAQTLGDLLRQPLLHL